MRANNEDDHDQTIERIHEEYSEMQRAEEEMRLLMARRRNKLRTALLRVGARPIGETPPLPPRPRPVVYRQYSALQAVLLTLSLLSSSTALVLSLARDVELPFSASTLITAVLVGVAVIVVLGGAFVLSLAAFALSLRKPREQQAQQFVQMAQPNWDELSNPDPALGRDVPVRPFPPTEPTQGKFTEDATTNLFLRRMRDGTLPPDDESEFPGYQGALL